MRFHHGTVTNHGRKGSHSWRLLDRFSFRESLCGFGGVLSWRGGHETASSCYIMLHLRLKHGRGFSNRTVLDGIHPLKDRKLKLMGTVDSENFASWNQTLWLVLLPNQQPDSFFPAALLHIAPLSVARYPAHSRTCLAHGLMGLPPQVVPATPDSWVDTLPGFSHRPRPVKDLGAPYQGATSVKEGGESFHQRTDTGCLEIFRSSSVVDHAENALEVDKKVVIRGKDAMSWIRHVHCLLLFLGPLARLEVQH